jgi:sphingomyelin phosphodiesterase acid-like 3
MHLLFALLLLGRWLLASDLHVEPGRGAPVPTSYGSDTNWALFDATLARMRKAEPNPQVVVLPGDFLSHHYPNNVQLAEREMQRIVTAFNAAFPRAQFVIVPGNNDDPCGDYRATPGDAYFKYIAHLWAPLVNRGGAAPRFERDFGENGWYTERLPGTRVQFIALDSIYWSIVYRPCTNASPNAPRKELQWLSHSLTALPANRRAVIVMHIPPGIDPYSTLLAHRLLVVPFLRPEASAAIVRVFAKDRSEIAFAVAGHMHHADFRIFGGVPMLLAPSISPVYDNNPAFMRLDVLANGTLQDYRTYEYGEDAQSWEDGGTFDESFGVTAFNGASLAQIHQRLSRDEALRQQWARLFVSGSGYRTITSGTWRTYWCAQTQLGDAFVSCAGLGRRLQLLPVAGGVAAAIVLALLAWLWYSVNRRWKRPSKNA